jgi:hypothetical protein
MQPRSQLLCHRDNIKNYDVMTMTANADFVKNLVTTMVKSIKGSKIASLNHHTVTASEFN